MVPGDKKATKARRKALRAAKRLPVDHPDKESAILLYKIKRNECRQVIRDAKDQSWENFLDGINSNQSSSEIWGKVNALSGKRKTRGMAIRHEGVITRDPGIIADALGYYFASLSAFDKYSDNFIRQNQATVDDLDRIQIPDDTAGLPINEPFRLIELEMALAKCKGKSAGAEVEDPFFGRGITKLLFHSCGRVFPDHSLFSSRRRVTFPLGVRFFSMG